MPFIPAPGTVEAELRFTLDGQKIENTLYFHSTIAWTNELMTNLGQGLAEWWADNMAAHLNESLQLRSVHLSELSAADGEVADYVPVTPLVGADTGAPAPNSVALCIKFVSSARGRSARGRNYISGWSSSFISFNTFPQATVDAMVTAYNHVSDVANDINATWVIVSRYHNKLPRTTAVNYQVTAAVATDNTVDSQRRRLPGRGQ